MTASSRSPLDSAHQSLKDLKETKTSSKVEYGIKKMKTLKTDPVKLKDLLKQKEKEKEAEARYEEAILLKEMAKVAGLMANDQESGQVSEQNAFRSMGSRLNNEN